MSKKQFARLSFDDTSLRPDETESHTCRPGFVFFTKWLGQGPSLRLPIPPTIVSGVTVNTGANSNGSLGGESVRLLSTSPDGIVQSYIPKLGSRSERDAFISTCHKTFIHPVINDPPYNPSSVTTGGEPLLSKVVAVQKRSLKGSSPPSHLGASNTTPSTEIVQTRDGKDDLPRYARPKSALERERVDRIMNHVQEKKQQQAKIASASVSHQSVDLLLPFALHAQLLDICDGSSAAPLMIQKFIKPRGSRASVYRVFWQPSSESAGAVEAFNLTKARFAGEEFISPQLLIRTRDELNMEVDDTVGLNEKETGMLSREELMLRRQSTAFLTRFMNLAQQTFKTTLSENEDFNGEATLPITSQKFGGVLNTSEEDPDSFFLTGLMPETSQPIKDLEKYNDLTAPVVYRKNVDYVEMPYKELDRYFLNALHDQLHMGAQDRSEAAMINTRVSYNHLNNFTITLTTPQGLPNPALSYTRVSPVAVDLPRHYLGNLAQWLKSFFHSSAAQMIVPEDFKDIPVGPTRSLQITNLVADFVKDEDGKWWFLHLHQFRYRSDQSAAIPRGLNGGVRGDIIVCETTSDRLLKHQAEQGVQCRLCGVHYVERTTIELPEEKGTEQESKSEKPTPIQRPKSAPLGRTPTNAKTLYREASLLPNETTTSGEKRSAIPVVQHVPAYGYQLTSTAAYSVVSLYRDYGLRLTTTASAILQRRQDEDMTLRSILGDADSSDVPISDYPPARTGECGKTTSGVKDTETLTCCFYCHRVHTRVSELDSQMRQLYAHVATPYGDSLTPAAARVSAKLANTFVMSNSSPTSIRPMSPSPSQLSQYTFQSTAPGLKLANSVVGPRTGMSTRSPSPQSFHCSSEIMEEGRVLKRFARRVFEYVGNRSHKTSQRLGVPPSTEAIYTSTPGQSALFRQGKSCTFHSLPRRAQHWRIFVMAQFLLCERPQTNSGTDFPPYCALHYSLGQTDVLLPFSGLSPDDPNQCRTISCLTQYIAQHSVDTNSSVIPGSGGGELAFVPIQQCRVHSFCATESDAQVYFQQKIVELRLFTATTKSLGSPSRHGFSDEQTMSEDGSFSFSLASFGRQLDAEALRLGLIKQDFFLTLPTPSHSLGKVSLKLSVSLTRDQSLPNTLASKKVDLFVEPVVSCGCEVFWPRRWYQPSLPLPEAWIAMLVELPQSESIFESLLSDTSIKQQTTSRSSAFTNLRRQDAKSTEVVDTSIAEKATEVDFDRLLDDALIDDKRRSERERENNRRVHRAAIHQDDFYNRPSTTRSLLRSSILLDQNISRLQSSNLSIRPTLRFSNLSRSTNDSTRLSTFTDHHSQSIREANRSLMAQKEENAQRHADYALYIKRHTKKNIVHSQSIDISLAGRRQNAIQELYTQYLSGEDPEDNIIEQTPKVSGGVLTSLQGLISKKNRGLDNLLLLFEESYDYEEQVARVDQRLERQKNRKEKHIHTFRECDKEDDEDSYSEQDNDLFSLSDEDEDDDELVDHGEVIVETQTIIQRCMDVLSEIRDLRLAANGTNIADATSDEVHRRKSSTAFVKPSELLSRRRRSDISVDRRYAEMRDEELYPDPPVIDLEDHELEQITDEIIEAAEYTLRHLKMQEFIPRMLNWLMFKPLFLENLQTFLMKR